MTRYNPISDTTFLGYPSAFLTGKDIIEQTDILKPLDDICSLVGIILCGSGIPHDGNYTGSK